MNSNTEIVVFFIWLTGAASFIAVARVHAFLIDEKWHLSEWLMLLVIIPFSWMMTLSYVIFMLHDLVKNKRVYNQGKEDERVK